MPMTESFIGNEYPFSSLITVIVFAIVTLFTFIRDSISLMDESILTVYNSINSQPLSENKSENEDEKKNEKRFSILENLTYMVIFLMMIITSISNAFYFSSCDIDQLNKSYVIEPILKLLETYSLSKILLLMPINDITYWIMAFVEAIVEPILLATLPSSFDHHFQKNFMGYSSSILLGLFFYFGAYSIHTGISLVQHYVFILAFVLLISFAIPTCLQVSVHTLK